MSSREYAVVAVLVAAQSWVIHRHGVSWWLSVLLAGLYVFGFIAVGYFGAGGPSNRFFPMLLGRK